MTTETITKEIPMAAFGKARPRVTRRGTFMPRKYKQQRQMLRLQFGRVPDGLIKLDVTAVRAMPKSWSKKRRKAARGQYAKPKPDIDNTIGAVMDALIDEDDRVVEVSGRKVWGSAHALIIEVQQVEA